MTLPSPPSVLPADRIARRAMILAHLVHRGYREQMPQPHAPWQYQRLIDASGFASELTPDERRVLVTPWRELSKVDADDATWACEPLAVLGWVLKVGPMPPHDGEVAPFAVVNEVLPALERLAKERRAPEREPDEVCRRALEWWYVVAWRLQVELFAPHPRLDLAGWASRSPWITRTPQELPLNKKGDLKIEGRAVSAFTHHQIFHERNLLKVVRARLRAMRWVCGVGDSMAAIPDCAHHPWAVAGCDRLHAYAFDLPPGDAACPFDAAGGLAPHRAAVRGDEAALAAALAAKEDVKASDVSGNTALRAAVAAGQEASVRALLAALPLDALDAAGRTALHEAARQGNVAIVEALVAAGGAVTSAAYDHGSTPLDEAIHHGHAAVVAALLDRGAPVEGDGSKRSPLFHAVSSDRPEIVALLLARGADPEAVGPEWGTALLYAADLDHPRCVEALLAGGASARALDAEGRNALHFAACRGNIALCERLVGAGIDPAAQNLKGVTAVENALGFGHADCARWLLDRGAPLVPAECPPLDTPLWFAMLSKDVETLRLVLSLGVDVRAEEQQFGSLLVQAATDEGPERVALLAAHGAAVSLCVDGGVAPLHAATDRGKARCVEALLDAGAPVDAQTEAGMTALHLAAMHGHVECARLLLARGADASAVDLAGKNALAWAIEGQKADSGAKECVAILRAAT